MTPDEMLLVERWRDCDLAPVEADALERRLASDRAFAHEFAAEARWQGGFGALLEEPDVAGRRLAERVAAVLAGSTVSGKARLVRDIDARITRTPMARRTTRGHARPRPRQSLLLGAALSAAAAAIVVLIWLHAQEASPAMAATPVATAPSPPERAAATRIALLSGDHRTEVRRADGSLTAAAPEGVALRVGDTVRCAAGGAVVRYDDGTELDLDAESRLRLLDDSVKVVEIEAGALHGHIAKQPAGQAMRFETSSAIARVVGTRLSLSVDGDATTLEVTEGVVALAPHGAPDHTAEVAAGQTASVIGRTLTPVCALTTASLWRERDRLAAVVAPTAAELVWRTIPWQTAIGQARLLAAQEHAPILAWVGWGSPLGCCDADTLDERRRILTDPRILSAIGAHCVPLAIDDWRLCRRHDDDGARLDDAIRILFPHTHTGVALYLLDDSLKPIAWIPQMLSVDEAATRLSEALRAAHAPSVGSPAPWRPGSGADAAPTPPPDALLLTVASRRVVRQDGILAADPADHELGLDRCWLTPGEWRALLPTESNAVIPAAVAIKLARQLAIDHTRDERGAWPVEAVRSLTMVASRTADASGTPMVELRGRFTLDDGQERCTADLVGTLVLTAGPGERIASVQLVVLLVREGGDPSPLVGISAVIDDRTDAAAVPPCGMRGLDYDSSP